MVARFTLIILILFLCVSCSNSSAEKPQDVFNSFTEIVSSIVEKVSSWGNELISDLFMNEDDSLTEKVFMAMPEEQQLFVCRNLEEYDFCKIFDEGHDFTFGLPALNITEFIERYYEIRLGKIISVSYTHLTLPTTPYV